MSLREFWDTAPVFDEIGAVTLPRLRELPLLDQDVHDDAYLSTGFAVNHGTNAPDELNKAARKRRPPVQRRTTGLLAIPPDAPPLDLSGF